MSFQSRYSALVRRHIARDTIRSDGYAEVDVAKAERRLAVRLPVAVRDYYLLAGRLDRLNQAHNRLYSLDELRIADGHLWFMEENQGVAFWGLPVARLTSNDPVVHQRTNHDAAKWHSEKMPFSTFLIRMYDWQAGFADAPA